MNQYLMFCCVYEIDWNATADFFSAVSVIIAAFVAAWGINAWRREFVGKRRIELAEDTLSAFLEVKDAIAFIRSSYFGSLDEGATREKDNTETRKKTEQLNKAYVFYERYLKQEKVFLRFRRLKYRYMATFGSAYEEDFQKIERTLTKLQSAWDYFHMYQDHCAMETDMAKRKELVDKIEKDKDTFYDRKNKDDTIKKELDYIQVNLEKVLKNALRIKERRSWLKSPHPNPLPKGEGTEQHIQAK